jgi:hypothetical protein
MQLCSQFLTGQLCTFLSLVHALYPKLSSTRDRHVSVFFRPFWSWDCHREANQWYKGIILWKALHAGEIFNWRPQLHSFRSGFFYIYTLIESNGSCRKLHLTQKATLSWPDEVPSCKIDEALSPRTRHMHGCLMPVSDRAFLRWYSFACLFSRNLANCATQIRATPFACPVYHQ